MMRKSDPDPCPVVWPIEPSSDELQAMAGDLFAQYAKPRHTCKLPADHVRWVRPVERFAVAGQALPPAEMMPHTCHCGAEQPVRDAEPVK